MKRSTLILLSILFLLSFYLCGCQARILSEDEIISGLPDDIKTVYINHEPRVLDVQSMDIEKRRSDDAFDEVHCTLVMEDDGYRSTASCILTFAYYDQGGWILDSWDIIDSCTEAISQLTQEETDAELNLYYFDSFILQDQQYDNASQTNKATYSVSYDSDNILYHGTVTLESTFYSDWCAGYWVHDLTYNNAFDLNIIDSWAGTSAIGDYSTKGNHTAVQVIINSVSADNTQISFSAIECYAYSYENHKQYLTNITEYINVEYHAYEAPTYSFYFRFEASEYTLCLKPYEMTITGGGYGSRINGNLYKGYEIGIDDSEGWPHYFRF